MRNNAEPTSTGYCARYVRFALEAGGINTSGYPGAAKDYGPFLLSKGFNTVNPHYWVPQAGDIIVFDPFETATASHPNGHIEMFDGTDYISDFKQPRGFWPGGSFQSYQPQFTIYRWNGFDPGYEPSYNDQGQVFP